MMGTSEIENELELQQVLWACYTYWKRQGEALPPNERVVCYKWVRGPYEDRFGTRFHQSKLQRLAKLGFLEKDDTARGGSRRYYRIVEPEQVGELLRKWGLN